MTVTDADGGGISIVGHSSDTANVAFTVDGQTYGADTAGIRNHVNLTAIFAPSSGSAAFNLLDLTYTINQTGAANGTVTGIWLRAAETAVIGTHNLLDLGTASTSRFKVDRFGNTTIAQGNITGSQNPTALKIVSSGSATSLTATVEAIGANFNFSAGKQWAAGAIAIQREVVFQAPPYAFVGASTITTAATVAISGAPIVGTNATITNSYALWIQSGDVELDGRTKISPSTAAPKGTSLTVVGPAYTALTLSTEVIGANFNFSASKQWATGALTTQREVLFQAPTYTFVGASTLTSAATVAISGAPVAGANATITNKYALWVQNGQVELDGRTRIAPVAPATGGTINSFSIVSPGNDFSHLCPASTEITGAIFNFSAVKCWANGTIASQREVLFQAPTYYFSPSSSTITTAATVAITGAPIAGDANTIMTESLALWIQSGKTRLDGFLLVNVNGTVAAAAGSTWNGISIPASTFTLTGAGAAVTELRMVDVVGPTITDAAACAIADFYTMRIGVATFAGAGPASATQSWSLGVDGNLKLGAGLTVHGTNVAATPYNIVATDYYLECRTLTGGGLAITANLPALSATPNGRIIFVGDSDYNATISNISIVPNGTNKINNVNATYVINASGTVVTIKANTTTMNWEIC